MRRFPCYLYEVTGIGLAILVGLSASVSPSSKASGFTVVLDPGHGGEDVGATVAGKKEKDISLAVARKVRDCLERSGGLRVVLLRDRDEYVPLDERVAHSLSLDRAIYVSLHADQVKDKRVKGLAVYSWGPYRRGAPGGRLRVKPLPPPPKEKSRRSFALAQTLTRSLKAAGLNVDPAERADYYVLKNPEHPAVLVELGFLSHPQERKLLADPVYQDRLAQALARGLETAIALLPPLAKRSALAAR